jgi:DNA-binding transcriptional MerR regulator
MLSQEHFRVGDLARRTGKTIRTIHYYEERGLLAPCHRTEGGFRLYGPDAPQRVELIGQLKDLGFPLDQIAQIIRAWQKAPRDGSAGARLRAILRRARGEAAKKIAALQALHRQISASLERLDRGEAPESPSIFLSAPGGRR